MTESGPVPRGEGGVDGGKARDIIGIGCIHEKETEIRRNIVDISNIFMLLYMLMTKTMGDANPIEPQW